MQQQGERREVKAFFRSFLFMIRFFCANLGPIKSYVRFSLQTDPHSDRHSAPIFAGVTRGTSLSIWERDYVTSARAVGQSSREIIWHTILPNILSPLIVQATVQFAIAILAEAALIYPGAGNAVAACQLGKDAQ